MSYIKYQPVIIVPAAGLVAFNAYMERNGYGANFLTPSRRNAVIGINDDATTKAATHYFITLPTDEGLWATLCEALKKANKGLPDEQKGARRQRFRSNAGKRKVRQILTAVGLKRKSKEGDDIEDAAEDSMVVSLVRSKKQQ